jgi:hypothetical protein
MVMTEKVGGDPQQRKRPRRDQRTESWIGVDMLLVDRVDAKGDTWGKFVRIIRHEDGSTERQDISEEFMVLDLGVQEMFRGLERAQHKARQNWGMAPMPRRNPPLTHKISKDFLEKARVAAEKKPAKSDKTKRRRRPRTRRDKSPRSTTGLERAAQSYRAALQRLQEW